jgi:MarR family 2-MHQ and catechol resistance regulon transcriptional repressor
MSEHIGSGNLRVHDEFENEWPGSRATSTEIVINLIRAGAALNARVSAFVQEYGVPSGASLGVLEVLRAEGGPLQPSDIARRIFASRPALSGILDSLQVRGLVRRQAHPQSRRGIHVEITDEGMQIIERLLPELHRAEVEWTKVLDDTEQRELLDRLGKLQARLLPDDERLWRSKRSR